MRWEALGFAWALASRLEWHWSSEWLGRPQNVQGGVESAGDERDIPGWVVVHLGAKGVAPGNDELGSRR